MPVVCPLHKHARTALCIMVIDQRFSVWAQESSSASQAENASSILVARSRLDFVATID